MKKIVSLPLLCLVLAIISLLPMMNEAKAFLALYPYCSENCGFWGAKWYTINCHMRNNQQKPIHEGKVSHYLAGGTNGNSCEMSPRFVFEDSILEFSSALEEKQKEYYKFIIEGEVGSEMYEKSIACWKDETCSSQFGDNVKTNGDGSCSCISGYIFSQNEKCITKNDYCEEKYGDNTIYIVENNSCSCKIGYDLVAGVCVSEELSLSDVYESELICGLNSYHEGDGSCQCKNGYHWQEPTNSKNLDCVEKDEIRACSSYSNSSLGLNGECVCNDGYVASSDRNSCIKIPENAHAEETISGDIWICDYPYIEEGNSCVEGTNFGELLCKNSYGENSINPKGVKNEAGNYLCSCMQGYSFNDDGTTCVLKTIE